MSIECHKRTTAEPQMLERATPADRWRLQTPPHHLEPVRKGVCNGSAPFSDRLLVSTFSPTAIASESAICKSIRKSRGSFGYSNAMSLMEATVQGHLNPQTQVQRRARNDRLCVHAENDALPIDNNWVERLMKRIAIGRKNGTRASRPQTQLAKGARCLAPIAAAS
jgi:hypothetical protein